MKTIALAVSAAALLATPALAQESGRYVQGNLGVAFGNTELRYDDPTESVEGDLDLDAGVFLSAAYGQKIAPKWAVEGEIVYHENDSDEASEMFSLALDEDVSVSSKTVGLMVNAVYEIHRTEKAAFYAGAGVGYGKVEYDFYLPEYEEGFTGDDDGFMWQLKAGVTYDVSPSTAVDFGYRFMVSPTAKGSEEGVTLSAENQSHAVTAGIRYNF